MRILNRGIVFAPEEGGSRQSCAFPGVCVLPEGRWLCGFRAAPTKLGTSGQHVLLCWSDDAGHTWSAPASPFAGLEIAGRPGLFRAAYLTSLGGRWVLAALCWVDHSDPALPFFNEATEGLLDTRIALAFSEDGGETWSRPAVVDTAPFQVPTPLTGPILRLPDGALALQFELNKAYEDPAPWRHASVLLFSRDGGRTWPASVVTGCDPENRVFYWDQRPAVLADGSLLDVFWTYDNAAGEYRNIHARESRDGGATWSDLWDTGVPGQPAQPVSLPGGEVALVYVDRGGPPAIKARVSRDGGRTWPTGTEVTLYDSAAGSQTRRKRAMEDAWAEMGQFSVGLPATAPLPGGEVLVVYYAGPRADHTRIEWVHLAP